MITILSKMPTGLGGNWVLVDYGNNFYAYGYEQDLHRFYGFLVKQCGAKDEVIRHCNSISQLCRKFIKEYTKEISKSKNPDGWKRLIRQEEQKLKMLTEFAKILKG